MVGNWSVFPEYFCLGALGAISLEWLKTYELKNKTDRKKFHKLLKSYIYWLKFVFFASASGFVAWAITENNPNANVWQIVVAGMCANALANKSVEIKLSKEKITAGSTDVNIRFIDLF